MIFLLVPFLLVGILIKLLNRNKRKSIKDKHVVITGGSRGIGKAIAILAAEEGAHVTIIARNMDLLNSTAEEIRANALNKNQTITVISQDVSNSAEIKNVFADLEKNVGPVYMLVNCAGQAVCGVVEDFTEEQVNHLIKTNYLGTLYPIQAVIPTMKSRKEGIIVITSSVCGLMGMYGLSIYASCKFALRGLAESISMELVPYNVSVTFALPPDTDTPGFAEENKSKPIETKLLCESGGLHKPEDVGKTMLNDALKGSVFSYVGFESRMVATLCCGMANFSSFLDLILEATLMGPFRLIGAAYLMSFHRIIKKQYEIKNKSN